MKAVLFIRTLESKNINSNAEKLRTYANQNGYQILQEFVSKEGSTTLKNSGLTGVSAFIDVTDFIESQKEKIFVICHNEFFLKNPNPEIEERFNKLKLEQKVEIKNYCHPCFSEPSDNEKIWRYINLPKFLDLIQSKTLFFTRADIIRKMDKYEGSIFTKKHLEFHDYLKNNPEEIITIAPNFTRKSKELLETDIILNNHNERIFIKQNFINCWHMNEFENFAMWKIYSENFGVCIQSTYKDLSNCFVDEIWNPYNEKRRVYIGKVNYINRNEDFISQNNMFWPYIHKGKEFLYEKELRCIINESENKSEFKKIKINIDQLINKIYINPFSPDWFERLIKDVCLKYDIKSEIIKSDIC